MPHRLEEEDIQLLLLRGYGELDHAQFLRMAVSDWKSEAGRACARAGLGALLPFICFGDPPEEPEEPEAPEELERAVNIAFTAEGLTRLGLDDEIRDSFSAAFLEGMHTRGKILGDQPDLWRWGNSADLPDAILLVFAKTPELEKGLSDRLQASAVGWRFTPLPRPRALRAPGHLDGSQTRREHFGFADGIGNPTIRGLGQDRPENEVAAGEFVLGYPNEYGRLPASPTVDPGGGKGVVLPNGDFGRNGSYLVVRQLFQDVFQFWRFVLGQSNRDSDRAVGVLGQSNRDTAPAVALAAKMVGRWPNGAPLARWSADEPYGDRGKDDDFLYAGDPEGIGCPIGSHIRRTNPRDSVPLLDAERSIASTKHRRLLRRGRTYGPPVKAWPGAGESRPEDGGRWPDPEAIVEAGDDAEDRGTHFLCFCANIVDQYEFVQQSWVNSPKFGGLSNDPDPLVSNPRGPVGEEGGGFTIQARPVDRRVEGLPHFVTMKGGAYFFMPGKRALRYLTQL